MNNNQEDDSNIIFNLAGKSTVIPVIWVNSFFVFFGICITGQTSASVVTVTTLGKNTSKLTNTLNN